MSLTGTEMKWDSAWIQACEASNPQGDSCFCAYHSDETRKATEEERKLVRAKLLELGFDEEEVTAVA